MCGVNLVSNVKKVRNFIFANLIYKPKCDYSFHFVFFPTFSDDGSAEFSRL